MDIPDAGGALLGARGHRAVVRPPARRCWRCGGASREATRSRSTRSRLAPPVAEGGRSLAAKMYRMLLGRAAGLLVEASVIEVSTDRHTSVEVWTISCEGIHIRASAPRLQVAQDMELTARLSIDGFPHTVSLVIEQADVLSHARASLLLRVVSATPAGYQRQSERIGLAATATLTALICGRIVPNEQVPGQLTDLRVRRVLHGRRCPSP